MSKTYYEILGVSENATQEEIKKAYRKLSKEYHPDKTGGDDSKFKEINDAYSHIGDESNRKKYDAERKGYGGFEYGDRFTGFTGFNSRFYQRPQNIDTNITISLRDAYYGCKKEIRVGMKTYSVDIPKGVLPGKVLSLKGKGVKGYDMNGREMCGDLLLHIDVQSTQNMYLDKNGDLEIMTTIDWLDAILGCEKEYKIFDKQVKVKVPRYTQNGGYSLVSGQGFTKYNSDGFTNLKVNFIVKLPTLLDEFQIKALEKIRKEKSGE